MMPHFIQPLGEMPLPEATALIFDFLNKRGIAMEETPEKTLWLVVAIMIAEANSQ